MPQEEGHERHHELHVTASSIPKSVYFARSGWRSSAVRARSHRAHLVVTAEKYRHSAEITVRLRGQVFVSREESDERALPRPGRRSARAQIRRVKENRMSAKRGSRARAQEHRPRRCPRRRRVGPGHVTAEGVAACNAQRRAPLRRPAPRTAARPAHRIGLASKREITVATSIARAWRLMAVLENSCPSASRSCADRAHYLATLSPEGVREAIDRAVPVRDAADRRVQGARGPALLLQRANDSRSRCCARAEHDAIHPFDDVVPGSHVALRLRSMRR